MEDLDIQWEIRATMFPEGKRPVDGDDVTWTEGRGWEVK